MSAHKAFPYREGTWFAVPLRTTGYVVGLVARAHEGLLLCYFFGPRRTEVPPLAEMGKLKSGDAIRVFRVADTGLVDGKWPIIGETAVWNRTAWPMPPFVCRNLLLPTARRRYYSDTDPSELVHEEPEPLSSKLESSARRGAGSAEIILTQMLG